MSNIEVKYESWKNGDPRPPDGWPFSNNTNGKGLIVDPVSLEPFIDNTSRMSTILIGYTIYSSITLRRLFESNKAYDGLPGVSCDSDEFVQTFRNIQNPMTNNSFTPENLKEIFSKIFANTKNMGQDFMQHENTRTRRSSLARGKRKKRKPTKKRTHTKRRIPRKRRRPTKRR
tara:strand:- start:818 stop:1336 length:519 start_codon:yes stop_codon:yes gene_type:complete